MLPDSTHWFVGTDFLVDKDKSFPILFETIKGNCVQPHNSNGYYNMVEVVAVLKYVRKLLDGKWKNRSVHCSDIGIISPYAEQCNRIRSQCQTEGFDDITIGTAEVYQGQEKPIIIISTVRSGEGTLGFVKDKQVSYILGISSIIIYYFLLFLPFSENECYDYKSSCVIDRSR